MRAVGGQVQRRHGRHRRGQRLEGLSGGRLQRRRGLGERHERRHGEGGHGLHLRAVRGRHHRDARRLQRRARLPPRSSHTRSPCRLSSLRRLRCLSCLRSLCNLCSLLQLHAGKGGTIQLLRVGLRVRTSTHTHLRHAAATQRLPVDLDGVLGAPGQVLRLTPAARAHLGDG